MSFMILSICLKRRLAIYGYERRGLRVVLTEILFFR